MAEVGAHKKGSTWSEKEYEEYQRLRQQAIDNAPRVESMENSENDAVDDATEGAPEPKSPIDELDDDNNGNAGSGESDGENVVESDKPPARVSSVQVKARIDLKRSKKEISRHKTQTRRGSGMRWLKPAIRWAFVMFALLAASYVTWIYYGCYAVNLVNHSSRSSTEIDRVLQLDPGAVDAYLNARKHWSAGRGPASMVESIIEHSGGGGGSTPHQEPGYDPVAVLMKSDASIDTATDVQSYHTGGQMTTSNKPTFVVRPSDAIDIFSANVGAKFDCETFHQFLPKENAIKGKEMCWDILFKEILTSTFYPSYFRRKFQETLAGHPELGKLESVQTLAKSIHSEDAAAAEKRHLLRDRSDASRDWENLKMQQNADYRCICNEHVGILNRFFVVCSKGDKDSIGENCEIFIDPKIEVVNSTRVQATAGGFVTSRVDPGGEFSSLDSVMHERLGIKGDKRIHRRANPIWRYKRLPDAGVMSKYYGSDMGDAFIGIMEMARKRHSVRPGKIFIGFKWFENMEEQCQPGIIKRRARQDLVYKRNLISRDVETRLSYLASRALQMPSPSGVSKAASFMINIAGRSCDSFYRSMENINATSDEEFLAQGFECINKVLARPELVEVVGTLSTKATACGTHCVRLSERADAERAMSGVLKMFPTSAGEMQRFIDNLNTEFAFSGRM